MPLLGNIGPTWQNLSGINAPAFLQQHQFERKKSYMRLPANRFFIALSTFLQRNDCRLWLKTFDTGKHSWLWRSLLLQNKDIINTHLAYKSIELHFIDTYAKMITFPCHWCIIIGSFASTKKLFLLTKSKELQLINIFAKIFTSVNNTNIYL